jgi:hypothetical protein
MFCIRTRKKYLIYENLSAWKVTPDKLVSQFLDSQIGIGKYEKFQIFGFAKNIVIYLLIQEYINLLPLFIKRIFSNLINKKVWHRDQHVNMIIVIIISITCAQSTWKRDRRTQKLSVLRSGLRMGYRTGSLSTSK